MKFTKIYSFIVEAKIDDALVASNINADDKIKIKELNDKLSNKSKYANFIIRHWNDIKSKNLDEIADQLNTFEKELPRIENKDIYSYSIQQLEDLIEFLNTTKSKSQREKIDPAEVDKVFEDDNLLIVSPKTFKACQKYGKNTKWCIVQEEHWNSYTNDKMMKFYIVIDKNKIPFNKDTETGDVEQKMVIVVGMNTQINSIWNSKDIKLDPTEQLEYISKLNNAGVDTASLVPMKVDEAQIIKNVVSGQAIKNPDGSYDVKGTVKIKLIGVKYGKLLVKFNDIKGNFICTGAGLTSLENGPKNVTGQFNCSDNNITDLTHGPVSVGQFYNCSFNALTSLKGAPKELRDGDFMCSNNHNLTTLEGAPERISQDFWCNNTNLYNLKHSPVYVGGYFSCERNTNLTSLEGITQDIGLGLVCDKTAITNLKHCPQSLTHIIANECKLTSLEGCPTHMNVLSVANNAELKTLKYGPEIVEGEFNCAQCGLTSLEYGPKTVKGDFNCAYNELTTLEYAPAVVGRNFFCNGNKTDFSDADVNKHTKVKGSILL